MLKHNNSRALSRRKPASSFIGAWITEDLKEMLNLRSAYERSFKNTLIQHFLEKGLDMGPTEEEMIDSMRRAITTEWVLATDGKPNPKGYHKYLVEVEAVLKTRKLSDRQVDLIMKELKSEKNTDTTSEG